MASAGEPLPSIGSEDRPPANQAGGRRPRAGLLTPASREVRSGVSGAILFAPGGCSPSSSGPEDQVEHGLGHCGSSKTEPSSGPSTPPSARLPDGKGCLWLPAEEAREPGAPRRPGAPARSEMGPGRGGWGGRRPSCQACGGVLLGRRSGFRGSAVCAQAGKEEG